MYFEINVAKAKVVQGEVRYFHFFATAERSLHTKRQAKEVYQELKKKFPEPDYMVSVQYIEQNGVEVTDDFELIK